MTKRELMYEGKAKQLYRTDHPEQLWVTYKDDATAFNGKKKAQLEGKARLTNEITSLIFALLNRHGIPSHFIERLSETEQLVQTVSIIPLEVVVRNVVAGSLATRLGIDEGAPLKRPIVEFYYKDDALNDPLVNDDHIAELGIASTDELRQLRGMALDVNDVLLGLFHDVGVRLIDAKFEFGRDQAGKLLLADEISPDTCRLWDIETHAHLDKDLFRRDLGDLQTAYQSILTRLRGAYA